MISPRLRSLACCPDCRFPLRDDTARLSCPNARARSSPAGGYLDLRPAESFAELTKYTDAALHVDARHETVSPPLLGAGVRNGMLRRFLDLQPRDRVLDLGCGSGRMLAWNRDSGAWLVGVDVAPFFAHEALQNSDVVLGDLQAPAVPRRLVRQGLVARRLRAPVDRRADRDAARGQPGAGTRRGAVRLQPRAEELAARAGAARDQQGLGVPAPPRHGRPVAGAPAEVRPRQPAARHPAPRIRGARRAASASAASATTRRWSAGSSRTCSMRVAEQRLARTRRGEAGAAASGPRRARRSVKEARTRPRRGSRRAARPTARSRASPG